MSDVCSKCGNNLYGNKTKCPFCGEPIRSGSSYPKTSNPSGNNNFTSNSYQSSSNGSSTNYRANSAASIDSGGAGWGLLGFCLPIIGIILYLVWQEEKPLTAKACLNGALISILIGFIFLLFSACTSAMAY
jgi:hypothetical protein